MTTDAAQAGAKATAGDAVPQLTTNLKNDRACACAEHAAKRAAKEQADLDEANIIFNISRRTKTDLLEHPTWDLDFNAAEKEGKEKPKKKKTKKDTAGIFRGKGEEACGEAQSAYGECPAWACSGQTKPGYVASNCPVIASQLLNDDSDPNKPLIKTTNRPAVASALTTKKVVVKPKRTRKKTANVAANHGETTVAIATAAAKIIAANTAGTNLTAAAAATAIALTAKTVPSRSHVNVQPLPKHIDNNGGSVLSDGGSNSDLTESSASSGSKYKTDLESSSVTSGEEEEDKDEEKLNMTANTMEPKANGANSTSNMKAVELDTLIESEESNIALFVSEATTKKYKKHAAKKRKAADTSDSKEMQKKRRWPHNEAEVTREFRMANAMQVGVGVSAPTTAVLVKAPMAAVGRAPLPMPPPTEGAAVPQGALTGHSGGTNRTNDSVPTPTSPPALLQPGAVYPTAGAPTHQTVANILGWKGMVHPEAKLILNDRGKLALNKQQAHIIAFGKGCISRCQGDMAFHQGKFVHPLATIKYLRLCFIGIYLVELHFIAQQDLVITEAQDQSLGPVEDRLRDCIYFAREIVELCEQRNALLRGKLKTVSNQGVASEYGLVTEEPDTAQRIRRLSTDLAYIYSGNIMTHVTDTL
ncbi:uncharacterized protein PHACADRAFT_33050 [Phanerochaete carnosa HHB-10118-sp]|uniref:DUF6532 domain-containing protein n=1 Tax=Phanerochaete carnosa (strain HHB-10118-sp) TaxID=650164 RepID=K5VU02_PHACS|nr:uncharacterized protein PHACADRAFT_33050 [Phanerochaete carnosa HHB-10118-sp]EKM50270.1 hypothetical protein PHACADRAFT_33050 [Phanerochaete carnosa HHB-10118-sp]